MRAACVSSQLGTEEGRRVSSGRDDREAGAGGKSPLRGLTATTRTDVSTTLHSSSSSSFSASSASVGLFSLRQCLDLLVRVQRAQADGVGILTSLRKRLFPLTAPEFACRNRSPPCAPVAFNEIDCDVVRLRILEVRHSGLNPKLSEAIEGAMLPFQFSFRQEMTGSPAVGEASEKCGPLWESCRRIASLREQFMGLAQLQEEAMQSLGAQLFTLFAPPTTHCGALDASCAKGEGGNEAHLLGEQTSKDAVFRFLQQLEDVMTSKQHLVVCMAVALRGIYDTAAGPAPLSSSSTSSCMLATGDHCLPRDGNDTADARVSVSVSSISTMRPSCPALREKSYLCERNDANPSPSPAPFGNDAVTCDARLLSDGDASLRSVSSRSPLSCTSGTMKPKQEREDSAPSPPPPLARCLERQVTDSSGLSLGLLQPKESGGEDGRGTVASSTSESPTVTEGKTSDDHLCREQKQREADGVDIVAENTRLRQLLESKDCLILNMQERLVTTLPLLMERMGSSDSNSNNNHSGCSCRSCCSSTHRESGEEKMPSQTFSASRSSQGTVRQHEEDTLHLEREDHSNELVALKEKLEAHVEDNRRLRAALSDVNEKNQQWMQTARKLKEDNKTWRDKERAMRARCEQLESDVMFLKKRLLTVESTLLPLNSLSPPLTFRDMSFSCTASTHPCTMGSHGNKSDGSGSGDHLSNGKGISPPSSTRSRSQTLPPFFPEETVTNLHTSASLQAKRNQLLARIGRYHEDRAQRSTKKGSPVVADDDPIVVVSPLTEERAAGGRTVATTSPLSSAALPSSSSLTCSGARIDRRLSPEYHSPRANHLSSEDVQKSGFAANNDGGAGVFSSRLSTTDVNRILASARSLLTSVGSSREDHGDAKVKTADPSLSLLASSWVNLARPDSGASGTNDDDTISECHVVSTAAEKLLLSHRRSISPCSSLSYSSARKRERWQSGQPEKSDTSVMSGVTFLSPPSLPPPFVPTSSPQGPSGKDVLLTPSPETGHSTKPRGQTAREALMRELREQLHLLKTQHAGILHQEEQLNLKREQVTAALQPRSDGKGSTAKIRDKRQHLTALLKRFDATQEKVRKNKAQLFEYMQIVERQLKTLEDDLL